MRIQFGYSRFKSMAHTKLFQGLAEVYRKSREPVEAEITAGQISDSLENDIRSGARAKQHGHDVISLGRLAHSNVSARISRQLRDAEVEAIQGEIAVVEEFLRDRMRRLSELQGESSGYASRVGEPLPQRLLTDVDLFSGVC